jgi:O-antigen/teichoic acid export membrane protein
MAATTARPICIPPDEVGFNMKVASARAPRTQRSGPHREYREAGIDSRLARIAPHLRIRPFDEGTPHGRTQERRRRAALTAAANIVARLVLFVSVIVSLRIALPYLLPERFGILSTITTLAVFLAFADLGIPNGLVSQVAQLKALGDRTALAQLIGNGLALLVVIGAAIAALLAVLSWVLPLEMIFKGANAASLQEARLALVVFSLLFGISVPLGALQRIYVGLQEGYTAHLITIPFNLAGLGILFFLPSLHAGIAAFLFATWGMQVIAGAPLLFVLMRRRLLRRPTRGWLRGAETRGLLAAGGVFLVLQVAALLGWSSDNLFISAILGPAAVASYVVVQRMFMILSVPLSIISTPLWSAYSSAAASGDWDFIRATARRSLVFNLAAALIGGALIVLFGGPLSQLLTAGHAVAPTGLLLAYAAWEMIDAFNWAVAMYLNGLQIFVPQVWAYSIYLVFATALKVTLLPRTGIENLPWLNVMAYVAAVVLPYATVFRGRLLGVVRAGSLP